GREHVAELDSSVRAAVAFDQTLMIRTAQEPGTGAARVRLQGELPSRFEGPRRSAAERSREGVAIQSDRRGHVIGAFEATLDLERGDAGFDERRDECARFEILWREQ